MASGSKPRGGAAAPVHGLPAASAGVPEHQGLLERVPAILYVAEAGPAGRWLYVSPQIEAILGFSPEQWCADPYLWARQLHPDDRESVLATETEEASSKHQSNASEYRLRHREGHVVWVRDNALLLRDGEGHRHWHGVLSDITEHKRAEAELERRAAQQAAVARLGEHALEGATMSQLMQEVVSSAAQLVGAGVAVVTELLPGHGSLLVRAGHGLRPGSAGKVTVPGGNLSQSGYTLSTGGPVVVADWDLEDRFEPSPAMRERRVRSGLTVVIEGRKGPFGVLGVHSRAARSYEAGDVDFVQALANVLGDAFERQAAEDDVRHRALHDPLTGLPNKVLFMDRLEQALARLRRRRSLAAILFLDLDRFKLVNDSLGHQKGDQLLAAAAPRIKQALRASDTVARFGGDEFGILLDDISGEHDAVEMAERIAAVFTRPFVLAGTEYFMTTSVGIVLAQGGELAEDLIRDADAAMYRAKERGRARYELFDELMRGRAMSRLRVENDLRRALERDELLLNYQPVVSLRDHSIVGVEALLRWQHPERGLVPPGDFIPVAEENGLIEPIGRWVLDRACRQAAQWYHARPDAAPLEMSVNLSAVQVKHRGLANAVQAALEATGLDPACLTLEITESVLLEDADGLGGALAGLKALGVQLVLDDFGTGYSSLAYLTRLPLDALKVDRSFVDGVGTEPRDTAITEAIVAMSHALSLQVVGEGAETALQIAELSRLGCDLAQGFYFARPVPPEQITRMLESGPTWLAAAR
ncbi:MAG: EAL domain-containing protein [Solirubrobacterales bacterium]|nr:EAL domain-containing protein [Solirubrobacterales bacterium]